MTDHLIPAALALLLLNGAVGMVRILTGPSAADRLLAIQLLATVGIGTLLLLGEAMDQPAARDVALVLAVLASVATLAFVRRLWWRLMPEEREEPPE